MLRLVALVEADRGALRAALSTSEAKRHRVVAALDKFADAVDLADSIIQREMGLDTPANWHEAFRRAADANATLGEK